MEDVVNTVAPNSLPLNAISLRVRAIVSLTCDLFHQDEPCSCMSWHRVGSRSSFRVLISSYSTSTTTSLQVVQLHCSSKPDHSLYPIKHTLTYVCHSSQRYLGRLGLPTLLAWRLERISVSSRVHVTSVRVALLWHVWIEYVASFRCRIKYEC